VEYGKESRTIYGTLDGAPYRLVLEDNLACLDDGVVEADVDGLSHRVLGWRPKAGREAEGHIIRLLPYLQLKLLLEAVSNPERANYVNATGL